MKRLKKISVFILFLGLYIQGYANMASPYIKGDVTSEAYSSRDIDIISEHIKVAILNVYQSKFTVEYTIRTDRQGWQIPLIFDTQTNSYNLNDFTVWVDGKEVSVSSVPSTYDNPRALQWVDSLDNHLRYPQENVPNIIGLKYFEANLSIGVHTIRVEYTVNAEQYLGNPVKEFSLNYNLKPARFWRSFGTLDIEIDATVLEYEYETNLSDTIVRAPVSHWHFTELPQDEFTIRYTPKTGGFAKIVKGIGAESIFVILSLLLIGFHIYWIIRYRKANLKKKFSPVVIAGSILLPLICCLIFMLSYSIVDAAIGEYASGRHGYTFFIFFFYPIAMPIYWLIMWLIDRVVKEKVASR